MESEEYGTWDYAKLFLIMVIPIYGFCFTALLAINKKVPMELKVLARGALIARVTFLSVLAIGASFFVSQIMPYLSELLDKFRIFSFFV